MELKIFKKIISDFLLGKGFSKKGTFYYLFTQDITIVIGLQKSNYSNGYYINIGYVILKLNPNLLAPRDVDGDVRARFNMEKDGKRMDYFDLEQLHKEDKLKDCLEENIRQYVEPITSLEKLKFFLKERPVMLYQTKLTAKQLLGFE